LILSDMPTGSEHHATSPESSGFSSSGPDSSHSKTENRLS